MVGYVSGYTGCFESSLSGMPGREFESHSHRIKEFAMVKHEVEIPGFTLDELAILAGNLRYDALSTFIAELSAKLAVDAARDIDRDRKKLGLQLGKASYSLVEVQKHVDEAWRICSPHML